MSEWDYGEYEGITTHDIHEKVPGWDIFKDGCPGGESIAQMTVRVDDVVAQVRRVHQQYWATVKAGKCQAGEQGGDVLIVTHGHFSKVSAKCI